MPDLSKPHLDLLATFQIEEAKMIITKLAQRLRENNLALKWQNKRYKESEIGMLFTLMQGMRMLSCAI